MAPLDALQRYPLFAALGRPWLRGWLHAGTVAPAELGDTLFHAGTPGQSVYLVLQGRVRVLRPGKLLRQEVVLGCYGPGAAFGEYALLPPGLNTATCRAAESGRVLRLPIDPLRHELARLPGLAFHLKAWLRLHAALAFLRDQPFLDFLSAPSVLPLVERFTRARFYAGQTIQAPGLADDRLFFVRKGQVQSHSTLTGAAEFGPGDFFGAEALAATGDVPLAEAVMEVECLALRRGAFHEPVDGVPSQMQSLAPHHRPSHRPFVWVAQREEADCAVAALAMVARHHGRAIDLDELRRHVKLTERGATLLAVAEAAARLGFRSQAVRIGPDRLADVTLPAIAHLNDGHYAVLYQTSEGGVVVGDPASGVLTVSRAMFCRAWAGLLLLLAP